MHTKKLVSLITLMLLPFVFVYIQGCGSSSDDEATVITLQSNETIHLGDETFATPPYGLTYSAEADISLGFSRAILRVSFLGEQDPGPDGIDYYLDGDNEFAGVQIDFNGEKVGLAHSDFPSGPANCITEWDTNYWEFTCPFTFSADVTSLLIEGTNTVDIKSMFIVPYDTYEDFAFKGITLVLQK